MSAGYLWSLTINSWHASTILTSLLNNQPYVSHWRSLLDTVLASNFLIMPFLNFVMSLSIFDNRSLWVAFLGFVTFITLQLTRRAINPALSIPHSPDFRQLGLQNKTMRRLYFEVNKSDIQECGKRCMISPIICWGQLVKSIRVVPVTRLNVKSAFVPTFLLMT